MTMDNKDLTEQKDWYMAAVEGCLVLRGMSRQQALDLIAKYQLQERLDRFPELQMHYPVEEIADEVIANVKETSVNTESKLKLIKRYNMAKMGLPDCTYVKYQYGDFIITSETSPDTGEFPIISAKTEMKDITIDKVEQARPICSIKALLCSENDLQDFKEKFKDACDLMQLMQEGKVKA